MNWFTGPIEQAILQSKKEQLIFMVHVFGKIFKIIIFFRVLFQIYLRSKLT
jgi:hypothetical protein